MPITVSDVVRVALENAEIHRLVKQANDIAAHIVDRRDLHARDYLERVINVLLGETAEFMVIKWLEANGKFVESSVNKQSGEPDAGHDLIVRKKTTGEEIQCSVKSSISAKFGLSKIISDFTLATKRSELKPINIQVYFWLEMDSTPRLTLPAADRAAIIGWFAEKDLRQTEFKSYEREQREAPAQKLKDARPMQSLLDWLQSV